MKKIFYIFTLSLLIVGLSSPTQAQFGKIISKAVEKAVEKKIEEEVIDTTKFKSDNDNTSTQKKDVESEKPKAPPVESKPASASSKSVPAIGKDKKYPFEQGMIYQQSSAMGIETEPVTYFDKYGDWTSQETIIEMKVLWQKVKTHMREITKENDHWSLDFEQKTGTHSKLSASTPVDPIAITMANDIVKDMKIEDLGEVDYLGYRCTKQHITSVEYKIDIISITHGNLAMQVEGTVMGIPTTVYVTKIDLSTPPNNMFEIPKDFKITETDK